MMKAHSALVARIEKARILGLLSLLCKVTLPRMLLPISITKDIVANARTEDLQQQYQSINKPPWLIKISPIISSDSTH